MKLISLNLTNFQGIKSFEFTPEGQNATVYGTNAAGKTTLYNALTWLLFDKASTGEKGFSPKTKDTQGKDLHNLEHSVEGVFRLDDGQEIAFAKTLKEDWTKKRGSLTETFSGHKTDYSINGVPVLKCDYDNRLKSIFTPEQAQVLTQPIYFPESMSWQDRRKLLLEVCGDITDDDVIKNNEDKLGDLPSTLLMPGTTDRFYTVEDYRKIAASKCKEINDRLGAIPDRIDEAKRAMPDVSGINREVVENSLKELQGEKDKLETQKAEISASSAAQAVRKEIADLQIDSIRLKSEHFKKRELLQQSGRQKITKMENSLTEGKARLDKEKIELQFIKNTLQSVRNERERLNTEYKELRDKEWQGDTICPTCSQSFPAEHTDELRAKFNLNKSKRLEEIRKTVAENCSKDRIARLERDITEKQAELDEINGAIEHLATAITEAKEKLPSLPEWEDTAEYADYKAKLTALQKKLDEGDIDTVEQKKAIQAQIEGIQSRISEQNEKLYMLRNAETQNKRIKELEKEEKQLSREHEKLQYGLYLCEEFVRAKVALLTDNINNRFESVKFRLFEDQINGGLKECCEVMVPGETGLVNYSSANNAARINAGLEIIDTLSTYWGITMPVFVDNAESVVSLKPIASQVIRLVVSEADTMLRVEVE